MNIVKPCAKLMPIATGFDEDGCLSDFTRDDGLALLAEFQEKIPIFYEDIEPLAKQADNLKKGR